MLAAKCHAATYNCCQRSEYCRSSGIIITKLQNMFKRLLELLKPKKQLKAAIDGNTLLAVRALIGKKVTVDIACYSYGFCYPEENILVDVTDTEYVFKSDEIESDDHLWRFPINDDNCSCVVHLA